tara:strand:+ start:258 stop:521 length:264 start_codon:yes stop_codon:yes gene_type:complete
MSSYVKVKKKKTNLVNRPKHYSGIDGWELTKKTEGGKVYTTHYGSLSSLADVNKELSFQNWRNVANGTNTKYVGKFKIKKIKNKNLS